MKICQKRIIHLDWHTLIKQSVILKHIILIEQSLYSYSSDSLLLNSMKNWVQTIITSWNGLSLCPYGFLYSGKRLYGLTQGCMVWLKVVWSDSRFYVLTQGFMFWHKVVWSDSRLYGLTQGCMVWHKVVWSDTRLYGLTQGCMVWLKVLCSDTRLYGLTQGCMVWHKVHVIRKGYESSLACSSLTLNYCGLKFWEMFCI